MATLVALLVSPALGRADPSGNYRPALPPDALTNGCWPLPGGVRLGFGYQVRTDDLVTTAAGRRRIVVLHFDRLDADEAEHSARQAFAAAGVDDAYVTASDFDDALPDAVVRGEMRLDLPPSRPAGGDLCHQPFSTKRFTPDMEDRS